LSNSKAEAIDIPERDYGCDVLLPCEAFGRVLREFKDIGGEVEIVVDERGISFVGAGDLLHVRMQMTGPQAAGMEASPTFAIDCKAPHSQRFKVSLITRVSKLLKIPDVKGLLLSIGPGCPLSLVFQLQDMGSITVFVAPLVEE